MVCADQSSVTVSDVKAPAPEVPQGDLYTVSEIPSASLSLLWASAL